MFTSYLGLLLAQYLGLVWIDCYSNLYRLLWLSFEPVVVIGLAAIAVEAYLLLSAEFLVDWQFRLLVASGATAVGVIVSLFLSQIDGIWWGNALQVAVVGRGYMACTLAVALGAAVAFGHVLRAQTAGTRRRNLALHLGLFIAYLAVTAAGFIDINAREGHQSASVPNSAMAALYTAVFICWGVGMKPEDDDAAETGGSPFGQQLGSGA